MSFRSTLAIEIRLSSSRSLIPRTAPRIRPCLLSRLPNSRGLIADARLRPSRTRLYSNVAGARPAEVDDTGSDDGPQLPVLESLKNDAAREESHEYDQRYSQYGGKHLSHWRVAFNDIFHGTGEERARAEATVLRTEQRAAALRFSSRKNSEQIRQSYATMSETMRRTQLPDILVGCLLTGARSTLRVLEGLPLLVEDFTIRMDCLLKLRREPKLWSEIEKDRKKHGLKTRFYEELAQQRDHGTLPRFALKASYAALILEEAATLEHGLQFLVKYLATYPHREASTLLVFVDFFTKRDDSEHALYALRHISPDVLRTSGKELLQRCTNLLKLDTIELHGESKNFKILPQLLELGIKPDTFIHNMIIMNAIKAKVPSVGWDLYQYLQAENLETTAVTYLLLMNDAFARQDVSRLNEILSAISKRPDLSHNTYLVGCTMNIIRIIYTFEKHATPTETFSHVLSIHNRAWNPNIYIFLNMIHPSSLSDFHNLSLQDPPPIALAWTILQYCLMQTSKPLIDRLWQRLSHALSNAACDPRLRAASTREDFYGGFIVFYSRSSTTLGHAADIVQYMLDSHRCQPTGRTWMRLMAAYLRHGQHREAEQIRRVMRRRGIEPRGKEFAYLLENWPDTEVAARARLAIAGQDEDFGTREEALDEELFEGVLLPSERLGGNSDMVAGAGETAEWDGILDLRT